MDTGDNSEAKDTGGTDGTGHSVDTSGNTGDTSESGDSGGTGVTGHYVETGVCKCTVWTVCEK